MSVRFMIHDTKDELSSGTSRTCGPKGWKSAQRPLENFKTSRSHSKTFECNQIICVGLIYYTKTDTGTHDARKKKKTKRSSGKRERDARTTGSISRWRARARSRARLLDPDWGQWSVSHSLLAKVGIGVCVGCSSDRRKRVSQFNCTLHLQPRDSRPIIKCSRRNRLLFFIYAEAHLSDVQLQPLTYSALLDFFACYCLLQLQHNPRHTIYNNVLLNALFSLLCSMYVITHSVILQWEKQIILHYALWIKTGLKCLLYRPFLANHYWYLK